jgi:hypothetical protein
MKKTDPLYAVVSGLVLCVIGSASASPPGSDPRLLSLVPPGAAIVAGMTQGTPDSYLALTPNNTTDLMDFISIAGVDPTRKIWGTTLVAASDGRGLLSEHSLLVATSIPAISSRQPLRMALPKPSTPEFRL